VASSCWKFRDSHLTRALKAAKKAGFCVDKAVIHASGDIELKFGDGQHENDNNNAATNPWDEVYAPNKKRSG
jgi:hypothetical protein